MNVSTILTVNLCSEKRTVYIHYLENILYLFPTVITASCILAVFCNFVLAVFLFRGAQKSRLVSKRLLLVINRCVVDLITALISGIYLLGVTIECDMLDCRSESIIPDVIVEFALTLNYWILATTYIGTSLLTFYSVKEPLRYKASMTMKKVSLFIGFSWLLTLIFLTIMFLSQKGAFFDANGLIYILRHHYHGHMDDWMVELCGTFINDSLASVSLLNMIFPILNYSITLSGYLLVACTLYCCRNELGIPRRHHAAICRLGVHFIIFTLVFILMAMAYWSIYPMIASCLSWSEKLTSAQAMDNPIDLINPDNPENLVDCDTDHLRAFLVYSITTFLSGVGWFSRMTIDTVVDFISDHQLRRSISCDQRKRNQERVNNYALCERRNSSTRSHSTAN